MSRTIKAKLVEKSTKTVFTEDVSLDTVVSLSSTTETNFVYKNFDNENGEVKTKSHLH